MSGGGGQQTSGTTYNISNQSNDPWHYATPALGQALQGALDTYWKLGGTSDVYPPVAPKDPWQSYGEDRMLARAANDQPGQIADYQGYGAISSLLGGGGLHGVQQAGLNTLTKAESNLDPYAYGGYIKANPYLDSVLKKSMEDASNATDRKSVV